MSQFEMPNLERRINLTSDIFKVDIIPGANNNKRQVHPGDSISDNIYFTIKYTDLNSLPFEDVRINKNVDYLIVISCQYVLKASKDFSKEDFTKYVEKFDKLRSEGQEDMDFRYLYDEFTVPVYKLTAEFNINPELNLPYHIRLLMTKNGVELLLYIFIYTLAFGYNYISLSDIIDYSITDELQFYGYTKNFFESVRQSVDAVKNDFDFLKEYMNDLKTEISLFDYVKDNIQRYYNTALQDQENALSQSPYNRKQKFIVSESEASNSIVYFLGDLEGDYLMILNWFIDNAFIDKTLAWIAPSNYYVIQCGDQLDKNNPAFNNKIKFFRRERGQSTRKPDINVALLFDYLYYASKGHVLSVIGNHDFASLQQDYRYNSNQDLAFREKLGLFRQGSFLYNVILARPFLIVFNNFVISHAGLTDKIIYNYSSVKRHQGQPLINNEVILTPFAEEVNNFSFYNKDLTFNNTENNVNNDEMFHRVINELMWNRDYSEKLCGEVRKLRINPLDSQPSDIKVVLGHNPYTTVNYCKKIVEKKFKIAKGGDHLISDITAIKVDAGLTSRKCKEFSEINYAVLDTNKGMIETKTYLYDCDKKNTKKFKFDINIFEILTLLTNPKNPFFLYEN